jgi:hypothetical protein
VEDGFEAEGGGIVKRMREKTLAVFVQAPEEMDYESEKDYDDDGHSGGHHVVDTSGGFYAAEI